MNGLKISRLPAAITLAVIIAAAVAAIFVSVAYAQGEPPDPTVERQNGITCTEGEPASADSSQVCYRGYLACVNYNACIFWQGSLSKAEIDRRYADGRFTVKEIVETQSPWFSGGNTELPVLNIAPLKTEAPSVDSNVITETAKVELFWFLGERNSEIPCDKQGKTWLVEAGTLICQPVPATTVPQAEPAETESLWDMIPNDWKLKAIIAMVVIVIIVIVIIWLRWPMRSETTVPVPSGHRGVKRTVKIRDEGSRLSMGGSGTAYKVGLNGTGLGRMPAGDAEAGGAVARQVAIAMVIVFIIIMAIIGYNWYF